MGPKVRAATRFVRAWRPGCGHHHGGSRRADAAQPGPGGPVGGYPDRAGRRPGRSDRVTVAITPVSRYLRRFRGAAALHSGDAGARRRRLGERRRWPPRRTSRRCSPKGVAADDVASAGANDFVLVVRAEQPAGRRRSARRRRAAVSAAVPAPADGAPAARRRHAPCATRGDSQPDRECRRRLRAWRLCRSGRLPGPVERTCTCCCSATTCRWRRR